MKFGLSVYWTSCLMLPEIPNTTVCAQTFARLILCHFYCLAPRWPHSGSTFNVVHQKILCDMICIYFVSIDINECQVGTHNCGPAFTCNNVPGSFRCEYKVCSPGQRLNLTNGACMGASKCDRGYAWSELSRQCEGIQWFCNIKAVLFLSSSSCCRYNSRI